MTIFNYEGQARSCYNNLMTNYNCLGGLIGGINCLAKSPLVFLFGKRDFTRLCIPDL